MQPFKNWKIQTIASSAVLGATYGVVSAIVVRHGEASVWEMAVSAIGAAALCAAAGSALYRAYETWRMIREYHHRPTDHTLRYRGTHYQDPVSAHVSNTTSLRVRPNRQFEDALCYRGAYMMSRAANRASYREIRQNEFEDSLCYRGARYIGLNRSQYH